MRHVAVSNETTWGIAQWLKLAEQHDLPRLVSVQNEYNLIRRQFDLDLAELSHHENVGLSAYSPLAAGVLTGKYLDGAIPAGSRAEYQKGLWRLNEFSIPPPREYVALAARMGSTPCRWPSPLPEAALHDRGDCRRHQRRACSPIARGRFQVHPRTAGRHRRHPSALSAAELDCTKPRYPTFSPSPLWGGSEGGGKSSAADDLRATAL